MRYTLAVLAYLVPTFALGFVWHLVLFDGYYHALAIYRPDIIIPFGFLSMLIQAAIFAWLYEKAFAVGPGLWCRGPCVYGAVGAVLSWSFTTLAVSAKNEMASVPDYLLIETAFTIAQWVMVAPLTVLAWSWWRRRNEEGTAGGMTSRGFWNRADDPAAQGRWQGAPCASARRQRAATPVRLLLLF